MNKYDCGERVGNAELRRSVSSSGSLGSPSNQSADSADSSDSSDSFIRLFLATAEELKLPLLHIGRTAELQSLENADLDLAEKRRSQIRSQAALRDIQTTADMSLQLLDSYVLSLRLSMQSTATLDLEPVSVAAVLYDTAAALRSVAGQYGVDLQLHVHGRYEPVMAHRQALQSAMISLGYSLIEALPANGANTLRLQLATHRTKDGIVAGMYGDLDGLTPRMFRRALELQGYVRQPFVSVLPGSGAGVFVAHNLLSAMASRLRVGRFHRLPGFAVTLRTSEQLQLV